MIIYLPAPVSRATQRRSTSPPAKLKLDAANLRPPSCDDTRGSTPKGFGVYGPAVLPLFCLAPHGVFPASRITPRAVSSYLAFSTLPAPRRGKLTASLTLPKNRRCLFCDTLRHRNFTTAAPAFFTRHAAVWCSDFPPANLAIHQRSSAIGVQDITIRATEKEQSGTQKHLTLEFQNDLHSSVEAT